ncbi:MAG: hypothetical protein KatS3mg105_3691 [Gemmatales bacterium]|nr:MAG: hypothetical protein KatS3mg105_3691 [Gemmatales bacterium]
MVESPVFPRYIPRRPEGDSAPRTHRQGRDTCDSAPDGTRCTEGLKSIKPTATQATLMMGSPALSHSRRMSKRSLTSRSRGSAKISIVSKPISLVWRMPKAVPCPACTQAELMRPSFMADSLKGFTGFSGILGIVAAQAPPSIMRWGCRKMAKTERFWPNAGRALAIAGQTPNNERKPSRRMISSLIATRCA